MTTAAGGDAFPYTGSADITGSLEFDGQTNDWFYEYTDDGGATVDHGVAMFGPEYNTKGSPTYLTNNTIPKGDGGHHLNDSQLTDDGSTLSYGGSKINFSNNAGSTAGSRAVLIGGFSGAATGLESGMFASSFGNATGQNAVVIGGVQNENAGSRAGMLAGGSNTITNAGSQAVIIGGSSNQVEHARSVILGGQNITTAADDTAYANNLHLTGSGATLTFDDGTTQTTAGGAAFPYTGDAEITGSLTVVDGNIVNGTGVADASINIEAIGGANTISTDGANAAGSVTIGQSNTSGKRDVVIGVGS